MGGVIAIGATSYLPIFQFTFSDVIDEFFNKCPINVECGDRAGYGEKECCYVVTLLHLLYASLHCLVEMW